MFLRRTPPRPDPPRSDGERFLLACILLLALFTHFHHRGAAPAATTRLHQPVPYQPVPYAMHFYFGGRPVRGAGTQLALGPVSAGFFAGFLPGSALTAASLPACLTLLPPHQPGGLTPRDIAADLPGLYGAPWVGSFNGNLLAALHVTVPRNRSRAPAAPMLQIYRAGRSIPAFSQIVPVNVVRGSQALLYRMFINGPVTCIDLIIPNGASAGTAYLYYPFRGQMFEATGVFTVQH